MEELEAEAEGADSRDGSPMRRERLMDELEAEAAAEATGGAFGEYVEEGGEYAEEGGVEEITLESVGMLMGMIGGEDEEARDEALAIMCELLGNCYGEDGAAVGQTVREAGGPAKISWLLESSSLELQRQALFLCSNLASDAVDPMSRETKLALLQCGTEYRLLPCLDSEDEGVLIYTCATVQNLCHELAWSRTMIRHGVQKRLEELCEHESELVVRYSAGALKNIMSTLATEERAEMSRNAAKAVETRAKEVALELFTDRRAVRLMQRAARQFLQLMCAPPLHRRLSTAAPSTAAPLSRPRPANVVWPRASTPLPLRRTYPTPHTTPHTTLTHLASPRLASPRPALAQKRNEACGRRGGGVGRG